MPISIFPLSPLFLFLLRFPGLETEEQDREERMCEGRGEWWATFCPHLVGKWWRNWLSSTSFEIVLPKFAASGVCFWLAKVQRNKIHVYYSLLWAWMPLVKLENKNVWWSCTWCCAQIKFGLIKISTIFLTRLPEFRSGPHLEKVQVLPTSYLQTCS